MNKQKKPTKAAVNAKNNNKNLSHNLNKSLKGASVQLKPLEAVSSIANERVTTISMDTIETIFNTNYKFKQEENKGFEHVRSALSTANALKTALTRAKNEMEALRNIGSTISLALNDESIFFSKGVDEASKDLFPESSFMLECLEGLLSLETGRLNRALKVKLVLEGLTVARLEPFETTLSSVPVVELVQKTGLSYAEIVEIINDFDDAKDYRMDLPTGYSFPLKSILGDLEAV